MNMQSRDMTNPEEKKRLIEEKADIINICTATEEAVFGKQQRLVRPAICDNCGGELKIHDICLGQYECIKCKCKWECIGSIDNRPIWVCISDC